MITPPPGWAVERVEDGLLLAPPEGPQVALLHYRERLRPLRRAIDLVNAARVPTGLTADPPTAPRRLTTIEGEHAALVTRAVGPRGALIYGYVFLDDYYAVLEGITFVPMLEVIEQLIIGDVHLLGRQRRRRFVYAPPSSWQGSGGVFDARWYPLDYPRNPSRILVNPALPNTPGLVRAIVEKVLAEGARIERYTTRHGLAVEQHSTTDTHLFFATDDDFVYSVRADHALDIARELVESIEPVPQPQRFGAEAVQFWAD